MTRFVFALACFCVPVLGFSQSADKNLPTERDTVPIHRAVTLSNVQGEILMKSSAGLVPVTSGSVIQPGSTLLVRRGALFPWGRTFSVPSRMATVGSIWLQLLALQHPIQSKPISSHSPMQKLCLSK